MIELHTWNTPNGRKISVALEEMGLPYTVSISVNISQKEQFAPDVPEDLARTTSIPAIIDQRTARTGQPISRLRDPARSCVYLAEKTGKFLPAGCARAGSR